MNPYSHLVIAAQLEGEIQPVDREEYYWGAVAPDVRYTARVQRERTHIPPEEIVKYFQQYPHLESFIQGFLVHRLTDLIEINIFLRQRVLFWPILFLTPGRFITVLIETYYIEKMPLPITLSGTPNTILHNLRIRDDQTRAFADAIRPFAAAPAFETAVDFLRILSRGSARIEKYIEAGQAIQRNHYLIPILFELANLKKLNQQVLDSLRRDEILRQVVFKTIR
jgi:hypothetical protein